MDARYDHIDPTWDTIDDRIKAAADAINEVGDASLETLNLAADLFGIPTNRIAEVKAASGVISGGSGQVSLVGGQMGHNGGPPLIDPLIPRLVAIVLKVARISAAPIMLALEVIAPTTTGLAAPSDWWSLPPVERGLRFDGYFGNNLHPSYPTIDRMTPSGQIISNKSLDLHAKSYQNVGRLSRTLEKYVDQVANFSGANYAQIEILGSQITSRAIDLAVPRGGSPAQQKALRDAVEYGARRGVDLNIHTF